MNREIEYCPKRSQPPWPPFMRKGQKNAHLFNLDIRDYFTQQMSFSVSMKVQIIARKFQHKAQETKYFRPDYQHCPHI